MSLRPIDPISIVFSCFVVAGTFTHSRTDVWGSIHPSNDAHNLGSDEIIIAEARMCHSGSDDNLPNGW